MSSLKGTFTIAGSQAVRARLNCGLLTLAKEMWVAHLSHVGTLELYRWVGLSACSFQEQRFSSVQGTNRYRSESFTWNPPHKQARPFSPYTMAIRYEKGPFPSDTSTNKSGLSPMLQSSCPVTENRLLSQSQRQNP